MSVPAWLNGIGERSTQQILGRDFTHIAGSPIDRV
jgi:hypothetical protein